MRSHEQEQVNQTGLGNTRSRAQNPDNHPQGFGKPKLFVRKSTSVPEGDNRQFDAWFDYLNLFAPIDGKETVQDIVDWLMGHFKDTGAWGDKPCTRDHYPWDDEFKSVGGTTVRYWLPREGKEGRVQITLTGDVIETVERHKFLWICRTLWHDHKARCTRLDLKLDDLHRQLCLETVHEMNSGKHWCRFRNGKPFVEYSEDGLLLTGFEYGSRESEIYCRLYDKYFESKFKEDWIRLEFEYKGLTAEHLFNELISLYDSSKHERTIGQCISALIAKNCFSDRFGLLFREHKYDENGNIDRRNRNRNSILTYWQQFTDKVLKFFVTTNFAIEAKVLRPKPALERCINFLQRSVGNAFSAVSIAYGKQYAESLITKGFEQLSRMHKAMVTKTQMEMQNAMNKTADIAMQIRQSLEYLDDEEYECNSFT